jgi:energy-coupling factor transport system permease protein
MVRRRVKWKGCGMAERSQFEFFSKMSIGQYLPTGSPVHALDPRSKMVMGVLLLCTAVVIQSLLSALVLLGAVIFALRLARVQFKIAFAPMKTMILFLAILALIQILAIPQLRTGRVLLQWGALKVTDRSIVAGVLLIFRFAVIVLGVGLFTFSTRISEIVHGIEQLLRPLQRIGFPAHELALAAHISIRFFPILVGEAEQLMMAQAARGADFGYGKWNFIRKMRKMLPLLVPLFIVSLRYAQQLTRAMESRCYMGGAGRSHFIRLHAGRTDFAALLAACFVAGFALYLNYAGADTAVWSFIMNHAVHQGTGI